jgi:hypothetical protein
MRLKTRIHEWLADRVSWVQYPKITPARRGARGSLYWRWSVMTRREHGWALFWVFWGGVVALSIYGNVID